MKFRILLILTLLSNIAFSEERKSFDLLTAKPVVNAEIAMIKEGVMTGKVAGMCGVFRRMVELQNYAKVDNGMGFIMASYTLKAQD